MKKKNENEHKDKLFFLNRKEIIKYKIIYVFIIALLSIISIIDINYNIKCYEYVHIILIIVCPPYIILYFILRMLKFIN